jgi:hypothetical protein
MRQNYIAMILSTLLSATLAGTTPGCSSARTVIDAARRAALYGSIGATQVRPSQVFCGNRVKQGGGCTSKATNSDGETPAVENVEVRGWVLQITGFDGPGTSEDEFRLNVLLDHGWIPASPAADSLNIFATPEKINSAITPHNLIGFGNGDAMTGQFTLKGLGPSGSGPAKLHPDDNSWGGSRAHVVHVEINGWGPARMSTPAPADWVRLDHDPDVGDVGWPFDPVNPPSLHGTPLELGDYVRLVGTLWEDEPHVHSGENGGDDGKDGKGCWNGGATGQGRYGRGYFEIHPVDYMAIIDRVPGNQKERLEFVSMCGTSSLSRLVPPPGPQPSPNASIAVEEFVDNSFTVWQSVKTTNRFQVRPDNVTVIDVDIEGGGLFGHGAKFKAAYRIFWQQP